MRSYQKPTPPPDPVGAAPAWAPEKYVPDPVDQLLAAPIHFHKVYADIAGGPVAGLFLSHAVHASRTSDEGDGWFTKTRQEWQAETAISRREQEAARRRLVKAGILEEKLDGIPARLHFRIDEAAITAALHAAADAARRSV